MHPIIVRCVGLFVLGVLVPYGGSALAQSQAARLPEAKRVVFLGDSITQAGGYVDLLETAIRVQHPDRSLEILNLGLSSETTSGLSEPGHAGGAFPRPDLHERLERVLEQTKPDLVVACYGMNDGIYHPLDEERFAKFKSGIERLHEAVESRGAKIVHLTPALFDAKPLQGRLLPSGLASYPRPYEGYDDVLEAYSAWLLSRRADGWVVIDAHGAMKSALAARRAVNADFTFASDGVHPNDEGHAVLAQAVGEAWGLTMDDDGLPAHPKVKEILPLIRKKQQALKLAWLTSTGHKRPGVPAGMSIDDANKLAAELDAQVQLIVNVNY